MTLDDLIDISVGDDRIESDISMPNRNPIREDQEMQMQQYNPFAQRMPGNGTWDAMCMERMLTIKRPVSHSGQIWITEAGFAETLSLLPLNKSEQRKFWKKFRLIQMIAPGELSRKIVDSRQERLMMELVSQKSRKDVVEGGNLNERESWITSRQQIEQTLRAPSQNSSKGFFGQVAEAAFGRR